MQRGRKVKMCSAYITPWLSNRRKSIKCIRPWLREDIHGRKSITHIRLWLRAKIHWIKPKHISDPGSGQIAMGEKGYLLRFESTPFQESASLFMFSVGKICNPSHVCHTCFCTTKLVMLVTPVICLHLSQKV